MKSLLQFLAVFAVVSFCVCDESHESSESEEDVFVPPNQAKLLHRAAAGERIQPTEREHLLQEGKDSGREACRDLRGLFSVSLLRQHTRLPAGLPEVLRTPKRASDSTQGAEILNRNPAESP
ncbi:hypothetical protein KUCAC02_008256 [Chaenocephalus aceratus]|uniref:Uncharacterized protein n=2 Tax=Chaenocephalus aceratus TaxID=36190 RepID=A0ACB9X7Z5_CHAAC|nr:hypothetical protein KUCAC02_008256 [Chaenocephalus aceratus]KAI4822726.1 hypothetical protein KUCAC02_008256 [Chaenocephalus aceratus]